MTTRLNSTADLYRQNEDDILGNGKDDTTALKAGRIPQVNPDLGNAQTIANVDGSLAAITTGTTDPLANTAGAATSKWSMLVLLRWLIAEVRRSVAIGATAANQGDASTTGGITAADTGSSSATGAGGQSIVTGTPTTGSFLTATLNAASTVTLQLAGTFGGTLVFERSIDGGTTWTASSLVIAGVGGNSVSTATTIGVLRGSVAGATNFRVRATAWTSGTANLTIVGGKGIENIAVTNGVRPAAYTLTPRSGTTSATIGTKTQVVPINSMRQGLTIENRSATATLTIWSGAASAEVDIPTGILPPGTNGVYSFFNTGSTDRFAISADIASVSYVAAEGVFS